jgi:alpha-beta hydrolase superfamily lysophospholipase
MRHNSVLGILSAKLPALPSLVAVLTLCGCAGTLPRYEGPDLEAMRNEALSVPEMREAGKAAQIEYIEVEDRGPIPVRYFEGEKGHCPVVLLHGLQSHSLWFVQSSRFIADLGLPVYAMDRRGSGISPDKRGDTKNYREMLDDIDAVAEYAMRRHNSKQVHILGHCFGAIPAALYASINPEKVKSAILPTPGLNTHADISAGYKFEVLLSQLTWRNRYIPIPLETKLFTDLPSYQGFIEGDEMSLAYATASTYGTIHKARAYLRKHEDDITVPVFMGFAGADQISDNRNNREFFDHLENPMNVVRTYDQAWHILEYSSDRDAFFADLADWFRRVGELEK